jgi:DNA-binding transcriptional ArsR family regulator
MATSSPTPELRDIRKFAMLAETFRALGDPTRVKITWLLSRGEISVGALADAIGMSQPAVSHHLKTLKDLKLARARREGRTIFYALDDEHINLLLQEGFNHVEELL